MSKARILPNSASNEKPSGYHHERLQHLSIPDLISPCRAFAIPRPPVCHDVARRENKKRFPSHRTRQKTRNLPNTTSSAKPVHAAILRLVLTPGQQQPSLGGKWKQSAPISRVHHTPPANHVHGTYAPCNAMLHTRAAAHIYPPSIALWPRRPLFSSRRLSFFVKRLLSRNISSFSLKLSC